MDAPLYRPAPALVYEQPAIVPRAMDTTNTSIGVLMATPAARAIILRAIPGFEAMTGAGQLKPHRYNFSPRSLVQFGLFKPAVLDRIDVELRALPLDRSGAEPTR